ncbi:MAG: TetR/AcrR family transcriptional regulator [Hamadaea sp.]|uniref:TetR/AcrR family transcriptional regulator n=1 Tax=Hamadaea sp. TaxID=2024425 RepID=UPI0017F22618|nr:TetR/AcrR family transcriptional regulator [Hamadaea sp.]NUR70271.1 TetR/AcrR family transcriptional regulator [Hamadaea sp.]NUT18357.1 TetR/AcrR family transcriptional regulator [Hamadaea sp.]
MIAVTGMPSAQKRQAILDAAIEAFLRSGFSASVDDIAAAAGVGKQTVYRHFGDKQALFIAALAAARDDGVPASARPVAETGDPLGDLTRMGERILASALSPTLAALHRLTIAEVVNHPELGRHWGDSAAPHLDDELTAYFRRCGESGALQVPDPARAARQFAYLLITEGRVASGYGTRPLTARQRHAIAEDTADLIVRAHRPA